MSELKYIGVQSVLIPTAVGSQIRALRLLKSMGFYYTKVDTTKHYYRFRQFDPPEKTEDFVYKTVPAKNHADVKLVQLFRRVNGQ